MSTRSAPPPWFYRVLFNTVDPFCAAIAAAVFYGPGSSLHAGAFLSTARVRGWLYFALLEAVLLRIYPAERGLWRTLCGCMLLVDAVDAYVGAQAAGGWARWAALCLSAWTAADWVAFWATAPARLARIGCVLGLGLRGPDDKKRA